jgi:Tol biopolymer transport system component
MSRRDAFLAALVAPMAALVLMVPFGGSAGAAWPGRSGSVVYVAVEQGDHRYSFETHGLRALRPGVPGSGLQLTSDPTDADPQVSPGGRTVVFSRTLQVSEGHSVTSIFAIGIDGSGLRRLTDDDVGYGEPAFYPSGRSIAFVGPGPGGAPDLYSMRLDGSNLRHLTSTRAEERAPAVSPTGRQIAFECVPAPPRSAHQNICSIRTDGSHRRNLTPRLGENDEAKDPDFSPSGRLIAFSVHPGTAADLFTVRADGSRMRVLTNRGPHGGRIYPHAVGYALPTFSPAGGSLVAVARPGTGPHLVRIGLGDPEHPRPVGEGLLGSSPIWAAG